jgi:hypothetical protein
LPVRRRAKQALAAATARLLAPFQVDGVDKWYIAAVISRDRNRKASVLYRIAAVLLVLFAVGHTLGFRESDRSWGVDALLGAMRSIHFDVQGFSRTYWDLFVAAGFSVGVFYLFAATLAWQMSALPAGALVLLRGGAWALALSFVAIAVVSWRYLFLVPIVFSTVIALLLIAAAWLSSKPPPKSGGGDGG